MAARFHDPPSSASSESGDGGDEYTFPEMVPGEACKMEATEALVKTMMESPASPQSPMRPPSAGSPRSPKTRRQRTLSTGTSSKAAASTISQDFILRREQKTFYTAGRPPWYNISGQQVEPFVIGICGGSASGKTTVANKIIEALGHPWVTLLSMDSFYKVLSEKQHQQAANNDYNFDHPDAFDFELLRKTIQRLKHFKNVQVPIYNFLTHSRETKTKTMYGANVIIFEGILTFYNPEICSLLDMKVFVDTDSDIRLARRLRRDITVRGRDLEGVLKQYTNFVKPSFEHYIAPLMAHADIIVPRGGDNEVAISLIVQHVQTQLQLVSTRILDDMLAMASWPRGFKQRIILANAQVDESLLKSLHVLPSTPQVRGLHTFIRNKDTPRDEFIFYSRRLIRLTIEFALSLLPFKETVVETPQNVPYQGKRIATTKIIGVSVLRAGETMEQALSEVCKDVRIGKILIQNNLETGEPELYYLRLPRDISDYLVILMDATVATGAAAMMAIRVLLDHDVPEQNILVVSLLMAASGVHSIAYTFPKVRIVSSAVDPEINDRFFVKPGIGNFGDRYFGTEPLLTADA